jgi:sec-independent protein translocase protein TatA
MFVVALSTNARVRRAGRVCGHVARKSCALHGSSFVPKRRTTDATLSKTLARELKGGDAQATGATRSLQMGLFGLGWPEIAVIAGVGLLIWGPSRVGELGRNLGTLAGNLKRASSEFKEGLESSLEEAEKEQRNKEELKLKGLKSADPTTAGSDSNRS